MQLTVGGAIIGLVELIKSKFPQVSGEWTVVLAVVLGGLAGFFHLGGLDLTTGIVSGLGAVGVHTTASAVGGK